MITAGLNDVPNVRLSASETEEVPFQKVKRLGVIVKLLAGLPLQKLKWFTPEHVSGTSSETEDIYRYLPSPMGKRMSKGVPIPAVHM